MDIFKKKDLKKSEKIPNLKSGTCVEIGLLSDKYFLNSHKTILEEFLTEDELVVLAPLLNGKIVKLPYNTTYAIMFKTENGIFKNTIKILSYDLKGSVPLIKVKLLDQGEKIQRRASFRLAINLEFDFDTVEDFTDKTLKDDDILLSKGTTQDISCGGLKFLTSEPLEDGDYIKILINPQGLFVVAIGEIIQKEKIVIDEQVKFSYKCKFQNIPEAHKEKLSKYIFGVQRNLSKKGVIFNK